MTGHVWQYFADLGRAVGSHWDKLGRGWEALSEASLAALGEVPPTQIEVADVLAAAVKGSGLPGRQSQASDPFGQPPLLMHDGGDFFIQALVWVDGTTEIHQHGFDGAFAVAQGSSLHVPYRFAPERVRGEGHLVMGDFRPAGRPEVLRPGDARAINSGYDFVHALFHLERPTLSIVVRNESSDRPFPQYAYFPNGLGFDRLWSEQAMSKRLQAIGSLQRLDPVRATDVLHQLVADAPLWPAFLGLMEAMRYRGWTGELEELSEVVGKRLDDADGVGLLQGAFRASVDVNHVLSRRSMLTERNHRLLLAVLANVRTQPAVMELIGELVPGADPVRTFLEWTTELASARWRSLSGIRLRAEALTTLQGQLEAGTLVSPLDYERALGQLFAGLEDPGILKSIAPSRASV
jgi:hypothetical protein